MDLNAAERPHTPLALSTHGPLVQTTGLRVEIYDSLDAMMQLRDEWDRLFILNHDHTPFQSWEWNYLFVRHLIPSNAKLRIFVVRDSANVVPLRPVYGPSE